MNEHRTCANVGTNLTQPRSGFDLEDTRRGLIARRVRAGAKTPDGHTCSNLVEQLEEIQTATDWQRENLARAMAYQMARLASQ